MTDTQKTKAKDYVAASKTALANIKKATAEGRPVDLADAKVLEAAGCWFRRNLTEKRS
jgi:hypothetical protein